VFENPQAVSPQLLFLIHLMANCLPPNTRKNDVGLAICTPTSHIEHPTSPIPHLTSHIPDPTSHNPFSAFQCSFLKGFDLPDQITHLLNTQFDQLSPLLLTPLSKSGMVIFSMSMATPCALDLGFSKSLYPEHPRATTNLPCLDLFRMSCGSCFYPCVSISLSGDFAGPENVMNGCDIIMFVVTW